MTQEENIVSKETIPTNDTTSSNVPKKNKMISFIIVLLVALAIGIGGFYYYFNNPSRIVKNIINTAYDNFNNMINKDINFDIEKDSMLLTGNLKIDASIEELKDLDVAYRFGLDYKNEKIELGADLKENKKSLIDAIIYVIENNAYVSLEDDYNNLIKIDNQNFDFNDIFSIESNINYSKDDIDYIVKEFKDILINSIDMNELKKSSDTISLDNKDVKVNKITYNLNKRNVKKLMNNFIDNTLDNKDLLKKLSEISDTDIDDIKNSLKDAKNEEYQSIGKLNIYTKGFVNNLVKLEIISEDIEFGINFGKDTKIYAKNDNTNITFTINEYSDEKVNIDYLIKINNEKITGNILLTAKEIKDGKYSGELSFEFNYDEYVFSISTEYELEIGAKISDIKTKDAINYSELDTTEMNEVSTNILKRFKNSNLYNMIEDLIQNYSFKNNYDTDYDYDYSY